MPFASNRGVDIYYEVHGNGPPMVLVHANPFDRRLFTYQIARFSPYFRLVALDIRGYGNSDKPETPFTLNDMADDVLAVCAQERISRAVFMGVSVGSGISLLIGLDRPQMCDAVILVGGSSKGGADIAGRVAGYTSADLRGYQRAHIRELVAPGFCETKWAPGCSISSPRTRMRCPGDASRRSSVPAKVAICAAGLPA
jgi:pimeloyl-ACP methyl ester carboxylesterase